MASLVIVPASEAFFSVASPCCQYSGGFRHLPVRQRNQFPCRSRLFDPQVERERYLENMWAPTLLLHLKERRSGEKERNSTTKETNKQDPEKRKEELSPTEDKTPENLRVSVKLGDAFEPSEVSVKLVGKLLQIEGKHEERGDDGQFSCRQFTRSFYLTNDVDIENLTSTLSKEGVLSVEAPRLQLKDKEPNERNIPIKETTSPEAVAEKKSEQTEELRDLKENLDSAKSGEAERQEVTSDQVKPPEAEPTQEESE